MSEQDPQLDRARENSPEVEIDINYVDKVAGFVEESFPNMRGRVEETLGKIESGELTPQEAVEELNKIN